MDRCPVCLCPYAEGDTDPHRRSQDHILPRAWGGSDKLGGVARNLREMCVECNQFRGACGHCLGALACVRTVADDTRQALGQIIGRWRLRRPEGPFHRIGPPTPTLGELYAAVASRRRQHDARKDARSYTNGKGTP